MRQLLKIALFAGSLLLPLAHAEANLLTGETVETSYLYPNTSTIYTGPTNSVVGPGVELTNFAGFVDINFSDTNIFITANRNAGINSVAFDGFKFTDINGTIPTFTNVTLNAATNYSGLNATRITFDANHIFVNVVGLPGLAGQVISLDINQAAVPEPSTAILAGLGGIAVAIRAYRRRRATTAMIV